MRTLVSGSRVPLLKKCLGPAVLGGVTFDDGDEVQGSTRGRALHNFLQSIAQCGELTETKYRELLLAVPPEYREDAAVIDVLSLPCGKPDSYLSEVSLAWNWVSMEGRVLHVINPGDGRSYSSCDPAEDIVGTLDAVGVTDSAVVVLDYKTGRKYLGKPGLSEQLRTYAVLAAAAFGRTQAVVGFIRLDDEGKAWWMTETLDEAALSAARDELVALMMDVTTAAYEPVHTLPLVAGMHCDWCPSRRRCPALLGMAMALGNDPGSVVPEGTLELDLVAAGKALHRLAAIKTMCELAESTIREASRILGPIPLGDGRFQGFQPVTKREVVDVDKAVAIVATVVGPERAAAMVERSVSMSAVEDAARSYLVDTTGKPRGVGKVTAELVEKLEKGEALTKTASQQFRAFTPKKQLPPEASEEK